MAKHSAHPKFIAESLEKTLFMAADKMRMNIYNDEYRTENVFFVLQTARRVSVIRLSSHASKPEKMFPKFKSIRFLKNCMFIRIPVCQKV